MAVDPSVIAALRAAIDADPDNPVLRLHLGELLIDQDPAGALDQAQQVLAVDSSNLNAVALAQSSLNAMTGLQPLDISGPDVAVPSAGWLPQPGEYFEDNPNGERVRLDDVGGLEEVKDRLRNSFLVPARNEEIRRTFGKSLRGGLLLWGPPGCGKTFLARAVAGELGANFVSAGLSDILDMYLGNSERNLHELFEIARAKAPAVLFLDEIDALGHKRANLAHSAGRNVVAQLLTELDGIGSDNDGVFLLAATNAPWDLDSALRRPGRFDRAILVLPPDLPARMAILTYHLKDRPVDALDVERLAGDTDGYSGADLKLLCESATELAIERSLASGVVVPIAMSDFDAALKASSPSTGPWFETVRNYAEFANESNFYDGCMAYLRRRRSK